MRIRFPLLVWFLMLLVVSACRTDPQAAKRQHLKQGDDYRRANKNSEAFIEYSKAVQADPNSWEAHEKVGEIYIDEGNRDRAWQSYQRAANLAPDDMDLQVRAGGVLLLSHQFDYARILAERVLEKHPNHPAALVLKANALAGLENVDSAMALVEQAIKLDPGRSDFYSNLASLKATTGQLAQAEAIYKKAIEVAPTSAASYLPIGNFYMATGRIYVAEQMFQKALGYERDNPLVHRALATLYLGSGQAAKAEEHLKFVADHSGKIENRIALADYYLSTGRASLGIPILEEASKKPEAEADARVRLAAATYASGRRAEGRSTLESVMAKFPNYAPGLLLRARFLLDVGRHEEALRAAVEASVLKDGYLEALYLAGQLHAENGDTFQASEAFKKILEANPFAKPAQIELSRLMYARGELESSRELMGRILERVPTDLRTRLSLVGALLERRDLKHAQAQLKTLEMDYPRSAGVHTLVGVLHALQRDFAAAKRSYETALAIDRQQVDAVSGLIGIDLETKNPAGAVHRAEAFSAAAPSVASRLVLLARTYEVVGELDKAEATLRRTIELDPSGFEAYERLGQLLYSRGRLEEGRAEFAKILERRPRSVAALTMIALILRRDGKTEEAIEHYRKVLEIDRNAPIAANNLAWIYAERGINLDEAVILARIARRVLPDVPDVGDTLGWAYYRNGEPSLLRLAVPLLEEAVSKQPNNALFRYHLGAAYHKSGQAAGARRELQMALQLNPTFQGAAESRKILATLQ